MKKIILSVLCLSVLFIPKSFSTPPTSIDLTYDQASGNLHVVAEHPSPDISRSFVRLMNVYVNDNLISATDYVRQEDPQEFTQDVPLTAQVGDVIKVDLFCSLGGEMAKELTVAKQKPAPPQPVGQSAS